MLKRFGAFGLILLLNTTWLFSQKREGNTPSPFANEFPKTTYFNRNNFSADVQFWTMCEDENGFSIFGNNDGVITFDGENWNKIILPNKSSVRSLIKDSNGRIYAGGFNEIGTLQRDETGVYTYTSLMDKLRLEGHNYENFWQAHLVDSRVVFRSFTSLVLISKNTATQIPAGNAFVFSNVINNNLWVQDENLGIYRVDLNNFQLVDKIPANSFNNETLIALLPSNRDNEIILISKSGKIYKVNTLNNKVTYLFELFENRLNERATSAVNFGNNKYIVGTLNSGIVEFDLTREVNFNNPNYADIKKTTIHNLYVTNKGNLWALLNNGLNYLDFHSSYSQIFDLASVYDVLIDSSKIYTATNVGVYQSELSEKFSKYTFKKVNNLNGQAWSVQSFNGDVIISHDEGLFMIKDNEAKKIDTIKGFWKVTPLQKHNGWFLASNYNGLYLLEKNKHQWKIKWKITGFEESTRDLLPSNQPDTYWVCHGYKGIYRIVISSDYSRVVAIEHFTNQNGLPSFYNVNATHWKNKIIFTTNNGIYNFDEASKRFVPNEELNNILNPKKNTRKFIVKDNKIWFVQDDEAGFVNLIDPEKKLVSDIFLKLKGSFNRGMESITPLDEDKVLFGTNSGLYLYSIKPKESYKDIRTHITKISYSSGQKTHLALVNSNGVDIELPNQTALLRFDFAAPELFSEAKTQYSYRLYPIDNKWSTWQSKSYKEYTHLQPGSYTFSVKSKNIMGSSGLVYNYSFSVLPRWYQTKLALISYFILFALLCFLFYKLLHKYIEKKHNEALAEENKTKKLLELEIAQLKLKHENIKITKDRDSLEENFIEKSKELANYTLMLSQKKDIFNEIQNDLKQLKNVVKNQDSKNKITDIFKKLHRNKIDESFMEIFDVNFEKIHHDFFEKLKSINPTLTLRELRLCAFIKMNLLNKEISSLLNISTRGVESARYRVRKKLNVAHDDNLAEFLNSLSKKP